MKKLVTTILVVLQICVLVLSDMQYLNALRFAEQINDKSAGVRSNVSPMLAVVNANFSSQMKMIAGLMDFAADVSRKTLPKPSKEERSQQSSKVSVPPSSSLSELRQVKFELVSQNYYLIPALMPAITAYSLIILLMTILHTRRTRSSSLFFLLPRGSIDDYIMNIISIIHLNPHCLKTTGVFSLHMSLNIIQERAVIPEIRYRECRGIMNYHV